MKKYDGPAFPVTAAFNSVGGLVQAPYAGMSLRDYFAANAPITAIDCSDWSVGDCAKKIGLEDYRQWDNKKHFAMLVSKLAYEYADAMLEEREP